MTTQHEESIIAALKQKPKRKHPGPEHNPSQETRITEQVPSDVIACLRELIGQELERVDEPRTARLDARLTAKERAVIQRAADISGRSLSDFVVHAAHQAALRQIEHQVILRLSKRDSETIAAAIDAEPSEPTAALKRAATTRKKILRQVEGR